MARKKTEIESEAPPMDGKRYVAGAHIGKGESYKDYYESDTLNDCQAQAEMIGREEGCKTIVFDRLYHNIVFRYDPKK